MSFTFTIDTRIERPPEEVFALVTDLDRLPEWQPLVVEVEPLGGANGGLREGMRLREVREVRGRRLEQVVRVAAHEPPRRFALEVVDGPLPVDGELTFEPQDGGRATAVRLLATGRPQGAQRLVAPLLRVGLRREFRKQYAALKAAAER